MVCSNCRRDIADYSNFCYYCGSRQTVATPVGMPPGVKRLRRSVTDRKLAGVCGGFAEYFEMDSTVLRIIWVLAAIFPIPFAAVVGYLVAWLVMPEAPLPAPIAAPAPAAPESTQTA
jgi:phage shock protein C